MSEEFAPGASPGAPGTGRAGAGPAALPPAREIDHAVSVLWLLADRTRLSILALLDGREMAVTAIAEVLDRPVPAVSQHLAKLRTGNLVVTRREGTSVYYRQPDAHVAALVTNILHNAEHAFHEVPPHHRGRGGAPRAGAAGAVGGSGGAGDSGAGHGPRTRHADRSGAADPARRRRRTADR
ncbi:ArsR/SmtB family transcription factor [Corynebacterium sphenisci]|uniref:ArsR/SmtB family transcription factor n=1 Tax=Corynebacterium sphenisci TaxID=191493 RepID=UPI0026E00C8E|nr:metalloregulator ArsR/SmtB family transcription factor [Corynebacterium sphenisci]MDO5730537.1 metalloregulator ArsR/SmtB family transcription factor [Corynebacterium sphenisci]